MTTISLKMPVYAFVHPFSKCQLSVLQAGTVLGSGQSTALAHWGSLSDRKAGKKTGNQDTDLGEVRRMCGPMDVQGAVVLAPCGTKMKNIRKGFWAEFEGELSQKE